MTRPFSAKRANAVVVERLRALETWRDSESVASGGNQWNAGAAMTRSALSDGRGKLAASPST